MAEQISHAVATICKLEVDNFPFCILKCSAGFCLSWKHEKRSGKLFLLIDPPKHSTNGLVCVPRIPFLASYCSKTMFPRW